MPITTTNSFTLVTLQHVLVDCSAVQQKPEAEQDLSRLIGWIRTNPKRGSVHVMLKSATGNVTGRKLRSIFQTLGCTVSMQTRF